MFKKRLNEHAPLVDLNEGRSSAYLFAKRDQANISPDELAGFRKMADAYGRMTSSESDAAVRNRDLLELCHDH